MRALPWIAGTSLLAAGVWLAAACGEGSNDASPDAAASAAPSSSSGGGASSSSSSSSGAVTPEAGAAPDAGDADAKDAAAEDTTFSFVVMPDTQQEVVVEANSTKYFVNRVTWINDHWTTNDFRFVLHTGDAANWGNVDPVQFDRISKAFEAFDVLKRPYAIAPGNHDTAAVCVGGSACPGRDTSVDVRDTTAFNKRFPPSRLVALGGSYEPTKSDNAFHLVRAGGVDWMIVTLELWPRTAVVDWAKTVVAAHPKHNVIFVTHMHIDGAGNISTSNGGYGANSPQYVFDNLYAKYPNVRFVFNGHVGQSAFKESTGEKGNKIFQLLNCFHSNTDNPTRIVDIDVAANTFATHVYAPSSNVTYPNATYSGANAAWVRP